MVGEHVTHAVTVHKVETAGGDTAESGSAAHGATRPGHVIHSHDFLKLGQVKAAGSDLPSEC